jgi:polyphosphate kinase 2
MREFNKKELELLSTKRGLLNLLRPKDPDFDRALKRVKYERLLLKLQVEVLRLQQWVINNDKRVIIIFEGRDSAGKGGAIRRFSEHMNPRHFKEVALRKPTPEEDQQWYFQRYVQHLPKPGEIVFFDRSWYNRAVVEPVNGFCTQDEYERFMADVNDFERMLVNDGIYLFKFYFSISKDEQAKRFKKVENNPLKKWKMSPIDYRAQELWDEYTTYKERMFTETHTDLAPWVIVKANKKSSARVRVIKRVLDALPYDEEMK